MFSVVKFDAFCLQIGMDILSRFGRGEEGGEREGHRKDRGCPSHPRYNEEVGGSLAADTEATSWMEGQPMITYHELREISPEKARELVRKVLAKQGGDVSKTARILNISRPTVRRARDGALEDKSRRPLHSPSKTASHFEELIVQEGKRTGFRYRRLPGIFRESSVSGFRKIRSKRSSDAMA